MIHPEPSLYSKLYLVEFTEKFEIVIMPSFNVPISKIELADANISWKLQFTHENELASINATPPIVLILYTYIIKRLTFS